MSLEALAKSMEDFRSSRSDSRRFKYPHSLKSHAIRVYAANPELTPGKLAKILGISPGAGDRWFKGVKQNPSSPKKEAKPPAFIEIKPKPQVENMVKPLSTDIKVRIIEVTIPMGDDQKVVSALNAILKGEG